MSRTETTTAAALPSDLELHLSALLRSPDPWPAMHAAGWARGEGLLCPAAFAAWCRAGLDIGKQADGASAAVRPAVLFLRALQPAADLAALRAETVAAYLTNDLGTGSAAATAFLTIIDLIHIAALSRVHAEAHDDPS